MKPLTMKVTLTDRTKMLYVPKEWARRRARWAFILGLVAGGLIILAVEALAQEDHSMDWRVYAAVGGFCCGSCNAPSRVSTQRPGAVAPRAAARKVETDLWSQVRVMKDLRSGDEATGNPTKMGAAGLGPGGEAQRGQAAYRPIGPLGC